MSESNKVQEYYNSSVGYCTIWGDVVDKPDMVVISENGGYGTLTVVRRSELQKKEDTWEFKQAEKRADELRLITAKAQEQFEKITEKVIKAACSSLSTRMKMNILFKEGMGDNGWAITIADALNDLVREETPKIIKKDEEIL